MMNDDRRRAQESKVELDTRPDLVRHLRASPHHRVQVPVRPEGDTIGLHLRQELALRDRPLLVPEPQKSRWDARIVS